MAYADPEVVDSRSARCCGTHWMELWYQPKVELRTTHLVGAEALVRARHPTRGVIPPGLFLPGASEQDMHELTERVILTALGDWEDFAEYSAHKLAVNAPVSALVQMPIARMLREARPRASNWPGLILKSPRTRSSNDLDLATDVAGTLRELKCELAVDDFGAGYSSLVRLKQLPFQRAEDRSQLRRQLSRRSLQCRPVRDDRRARPPLGLRTVAEGIETTREATSCSPSAARSGRVICLRSRCQKPIFSVACARV